MVKIRDLEFAIRALCIVTEESVDSNVMLWVE